MNSQFNKRAKLTNEFNERAKTIVLERTRAIPVDVEIHRGVMLASAASKWGNLRIVNKFSQLTGDTEGVEATYRTKFDLYVSETGKYYLHKLGESSLSSEETFKSIIEFNSPQEFSEILKNPEKKELRVSEPIISLLLIVTKNSVLAEETRESWGQLLKRKV